MILRAVCWRRSAASAGGTPTRGGARTDADEEDEDEEHAQHGEERRGEGRGDAAERGDAAHDSEDADGLQAGGEAGGPAGDRGEGDGDGDDEGVE